MKKSLSLAAALLTLLAGCSMFNSRTTIDSVTLAQGSAKGTIIAVDQSTRDLVIRGDQGDLLGLTAGPEVKNFPQIRTGDHISFDYTATVLLELVKNGDGTAGIETKNNKETAAAGQKPSATGQRTVVVTSVITAVDTGAGTVTVRGPANGALTVRARNPENLSKVKVGDQIVATVTFSAAIAVTSAPAATP